MTEVRMLIYLLFGMKVILPGWIIVARSCYLWYIGVELSFFSLYLRLNTLSPSY